MDNGGTPPPKNTPAPFQRHSSLGRGAKGFLEYTEFTPNTEQSSEQPNTAKGFLSYASSPAKERKTASTIEGPKANTRNLRKLQKIAKNIFAQHKLYLQISVLEEELSASLKQMKKTFFEKNPQMCQNIDDIDKERDESQRTNATFGSRLLEIKDRLHETIKSKELDDRALDAQLEVLVYLMESAYIMKRTKFHGPHSRSRNNLEKDSQPSKNNQGLSIGTEKDEFLNELSKELQSELLNTKTSKKPFFPVPQSLTESQEGSSFTSSAPHSPTKKDFTPPFRTTSSFTTSSRSPPIMSSNSSSPPPLFSTTSSSPSSLRSSPDTPSFLPPSHSSSLHPPSPPLYPPSPPLLPPSPPLLPPSPPLLPPSPPLLPPSPPLPPPTVRISFPPTLPPLTPRCVTISPVPTLSPRPLSTRRVTISPVPALSPRPPSIRPAAVSPVPMFPPSPPLPPPVAPLPEITPPSPPLFPPEDLTPCPSVDEKKGSRVKKGSSFSLGDAKLIKKETGGSPENSYRISPRSPKKPRPNSQCAPSLISSQRLELFKTPEAQKKDKKRKKARQTVLFSRKEKGSGVVELAAVNTDDETTPVNEDEIGRVSVQDLVRFLIRGACSPFQRSAFLLTYKRYASSLEILKILACCLREEDREGKWEREKEGGEGEGEGSGRKATSLKIIFFLKCWWEEAAQDLVEDEVYAKFLALLKEIEKIHPVLTQKCISNFQTKKENLCLFLSCSPSPFYGRGGGREGERRESPFDLEGTSFDAGLMAATITVHEFSIFEKISAEELLWWNTKKKDQCKNVLAMISLSTKLSSWVTTELVKRAKISERILVFSKFVSLAEILLDLRNFSSTFSVLGALSNTAIYRMKKTRNESDAEVVHRFDKMKAIMSHRASYAAYRAYLKGLDPPCIPYIGISLSDLTFIDDGSVDYVDTDLVNFKKWKMMATVIGELKAYQKVNYSHLLEDNSQAMSFAISLHKYESLTEKQCIFYSKLVEPTDQEEAMKEVLQMYKEAQKKLEEYEKNHGENG